VIDTSQLTSRVDRLIRDEQENWNFVTQALRKNAMEILDGKFENYLKNHLNNRYLHGLRCGELISGAVITLAKQPVGSNLLDSASRNVNSDQREREIIKLIWDAAKEEAVKLEILQLYKFITILKTKDLKTAVAFLHIIESTLV